MALAKNSVVIPKAALLPANEEGQESFGFGGGGIPLVGTVESISPWVVCWMNGTKVTYLTATELLQLGAVSADLTVYYHHRVKVTADPDAPADAAGQGASEGLVIGFFTLIVGAVDYLVVQFSANDIAVVPKSACTLLN